MGDHVQRTGHDVDEGSGGGERRARPVEEQRRRSHTGAFVVQLDPVDGDRRHQGAGGRLGPWAGLGPVRRGAGTGACPPRVQLRRVADAAPRISFSRRCSCAWSMRRRARSSRSRTTGWRWSSDDAWVPVGRRPRPLRRRSIVTTCWLGTRGRPKPSHTIDPMTGIRSTMTNHAELREVADEPLVGGDHVVEAVDPDEDERDPDDASDDVRHCLSLLGPGPSGLRRAHRSVEGAGSPRAPGAARGPGASRRGPGGPGDRALAPTRRSGAPGSAPCPGASCPTRCRPTSTGPAGGPR